MAPGENKSRLVARRIDEGLRMDAHPGIVFRPGPGGRRAGLAAGPDVWEVVRVLKEVEESGEAAIKKSAKLTGLAIHQVRTAARYYQEFTDEVDAWIAEVDREGLGIIDRIRSKARLSEEEALDLANKVVHEVRSQGGRKRKS